MVEPNYSRKLTEPASKKPIIIYPAKSIGINYANEEFLKASQETMDKIYNQEQLAKTQATKPSRFTGLIRKLFKN